MNKKARIAVISALSGLLALTIYYNYEYDYEPVYGIYSEEDLPFGRYSKGDIYIGTEGFINGVKDKVNEDDILIIMGYQDEDPNVTIVSSHEITDRNERYEILKVLQLYSDKYPGDWNRTFESTRVEWTVHNLLYDLGIERDRTADCDLDNSEESLYNNQLLRRLIK